MKSAEEKAPPAKGRLFILSSTHRQANGVSPCQIPELPLPHKTDSGTVAVTRVAAGVKKFIVHGYGIGVFRAYTSSDWWHELMPRAELICFPKGKTKFIRPNGTIGTSPGHGTALIGAGAVACDALIRSGLGMVWDRRGESK